jgi:hypothetical protein
VNARRLRTGMALALALLALALVASTSGDSVLGRGGAVLAQVEAAPAPIAGDLTQAEAAPLDIDAPMDLAQQPAAGKMVLSFAAKFVCLKPLQVGTLYYGTNAPLIEERTDVLIHNPNAYPISVYKKAVIAPIEDTPERAPGKWKKLDIKPDYAWRIDCDDIAKLLTGNAAATFLGTYGVGQRVEGFVVIGMGPQTVTGALKFGSLDVTAEYTRGSEFLKKDIPYQPWWTWWWWPLPWKLGYPYQRIVAVDPATNIDCGALLNNSLNQDAQAIADTQQRALTLAALTEGRKLGPSTLLTLPKGQDPPRPQDARDPTALVALIGACDKLSTANGIVATIDYVLVSNKGPNDTDPRTPTQVAVFYPWIPGRWYDLAVVVPQNRNVDLDHYIREWQIQRWVEAGTAANTARAAINSYFFPWWCGWGYWHWQWNGGCTDIGVGAGESIDVEQVTPTRVFMNVWPPQ